MCYSAYINTNKRHSYFRALGLTQLYFMYFSNSSDIYFVEFRPGIEKIWATEVECFLVSM